MEFEPHSVVQRILAGDRSAESELVSHFSRTVMFMLRKRTKNEQMAEDLHQDTLRIVLERLRSNRSINDPQRLAGFVHRTAHNVYIEYVRKESRRDTHANSDIIDSTAATQPTQLESLLRREKVRAVREMIASMSVARDRDVLHRFYVLSQDKNLIGKALNLSSEHFDRVISRARKRFRQAIEQAGVSFDE